MAGPNTDCPVQCKGGASATSPPAEGSTHYCGTGGCKGTTTWGTQGVQLACGMCVCVVGGGNIAGATASWLGRPDKNLCVHVLTRQPEKWTHNVRVRANPLCRWGAMKPYETNIQLYVCHRALLSLALPHRNPPGHSNTMSCASCSFLTQDYC